MLRLDLLRQLLLCPDLLQPRVLLTLDAPESLQLPCAVLLVLHLLEPRLHHLQPLPMRPHLPLLLFQLGRRVVEVRLERLGRLPKLHQFGMEQLPRLEQFFLCGCVDAQSPILHRVVGHLYLPPTKSERDVGGGNVGRRGLELMATLASKKRTCGRGSGCGEWSALNVPPSAATLASVASANASSTSCGLSSSYICTRT